MGLIAVILNEDNVSHSIICWFSPLKALSAIVSIASCILNDDNVSHSTVTPSNAPPWIIINTVASSVSTFLNTVLNVVSLNRLSFGCGTTPRVEGA